MIKRFISFAAVISSVFFFLSCNTPQDVLDDYNKHFAKVAAVSQTIFDADNAASMLQAFYRVDIDHTLVLTAPFGCESYSWKITDIGGKTPNPPYIEQSGIRLKIYIPQTVLYTAVRNADGKSRLYDVTLTVTYKGKVYSDTAVLALYATD